MISSNEIYARFETVYYIRLQYLSYVTEIGAMRDKPAWSVYDAIKHLKYIIDYHLDYYKGRLMEGLKT